MPKLGETSNNFLESLIGKIIRISLRERPDNQTATLLAFDEFTIIISNKNTQHMVYKHAIESICEA